MEPNPNNPFADALLCRGACALPATATGEMMYMPGGLQTITPFAGGIDKPIQVMVNKDGAKELEKQRAALTAKGKRPYFDFEHTDHGASYWPESFYWKDGAEPGIYCRGEWTADGKAGVEGKTWRMFSPVFHVDSKTARPAQLVCRDWASANMGGLVNEAAFKTISPLWAKNAGGAQSTQPNENMTPEEIKALQDKIVELQSEITRLKGEQSAAESKGQTNDIVASKLEAKEAQLKASSLELEMGALKAKNGEHETAIKARNLADAKIAVAAAVAIGAIAAKDTESIAHWEKDIAERPEQAAVLAKMGGQQALAPGRISTPGVVVLKDSPNQVMKDYGAVLAKNAGLRLSDETRKEKGRLAREAAGIYAKHIKGDEVIIGMPMEDAIKAADFSDPNGNVGLLAGSLVLQKSMDMMKYEYPVLKSITSDFSDEPGQLNQTQNTRITMKPAVQTYNPTLGTDGRPLGWTTTSPAQSIDVPVTLTDYIGVPTVFGMSVLASTARKLFEDAAPQAMYAIGGYAVGMLTGLCTTANFNAYAGTSIGTGATTSGSKNITFASNAIVYPGQPISGTGIPANSFIVSVTSATAAVINQNATATNTGLTFTLGTGKVPTVYASYVKALASFAVASLDDIAVAFDLNEVPLQDRFAMLNSAYYRKLGSDASVNGLFAALSNPEIITERRMPKLAGFDCQNAPFFPTSSNRTGFAGTKAALILKSRLPQDISGALAGVTAPGSVSTVTEPETGLTCSLVQYINLQGNYAEWRPEIMLGAAVGERRAGMVMTSV